MPRIRIKISIDYGDVQVVLYGKSLERSHIDVVGSSISMAAKIISVAHTGQIIVGRSLYENLPSSMRPQDFTTLDVDTSRWSYVDEKSESYRLYLLK
jgi:class 3 adenylate cyclase